MLIFVKFVFVLQAFAVLCGIGVACYTRSLSIEGMFRLLMSIALGVWAGILIWS